MHRYLIVVRNIEDPSSCKRLALIQSALLSTPAWKVAYENSSLFAAYRPAARETNAIHRLGQSRGVILGSLYHRTASHEVPCSVADLGEQESLRVATSSGLHLVRHYWGSYVALIYDESRQACSLLRDPTANLCCYHAQWDGLHIFFSDMEDFRRYVRMPISISWPHIAARLYAGFSFTRDSAVKEVEDLPGGERVTLSRGTERRALLWHPSQFCVTDELEDTRRASDEMRSTVLSVVHALASEHERVLVLLSGGLDSSIVTSCLSQLRHRPEITCINFFISGDTSSRQSETITIPGMNEENLAKVRRSIGNADERDYARKVAQGCGFDLVEKERLVSDIDYERLYDAPLTPRPSAYGFVLDVDDGERDCAIATNSTACFTGQGGDTVFYATQRVLGALDYAYLHPLGPRLLHEIYSATKLSQESFAHVLGKVIMYGYLRRPLPPPLDPTKHFSLLKDDVVAAVHSRHWHHPWIDALPRLCPGKRAHVLGVTDSVPLYHHTYHRERVAPSIHPLASQPVVETCLRIPTYVLLSSGTSRGLARQTFGDLLPREVRRRTAKGTGMALCQRVVRRNMHSIREHLLDGPLVRNDLLDRRKVEKYLTDEQPFLTVEAPRILDYLACQAWLTQVSSMK